MAFPFLNYLSTFASASGPRPDHAGTTDDNSTSAQSVHRALEGGICWQPIFAKGQKSSFLLLLLVYKFGLLFAF